MSREVMVAYLRYVHGAYNALMFFGFIWMGTLGLRIRRARKKGELARAAVKRHRRVGPYMAPMGIAGFFAGTVIIYLDRGRIFYFPLHFAVGLTIASLIATTYFVSRTIRLPVDSRQRSAHMALGITILSLYAIQCLLGLGILL